jgi:class 3 adenylate cyclase
LADDVGQRANQDAVMDIPGWLRNLGLEKYEAAFRDNEINEKVLPKLTAEDLKDIGIGIVGHRRVLLDAIAALRAELNGKAAPAASASTPPSTPMASATLYPDAAGERRYLTVMFCDLVDSTGISARIDAEEWRDLVGSYLDAASVAVTEMGGQVAKKLGDGLLALFGYPIAQENDAERAVRAALAIQRALTELNRKNAGMGKPELAARIGIETGPAVVDASGEIYGDVANVAARVQALADPGAVLATARVQRQVAGQFVAEERGSHALKGVLEPVALYQMVRASGGGRRSGQRQRTPLVGRDEEMAMLMRRWDRARQGDGQFVLIVGEPGLGKSRLLEEFHGRLRDIRHTWTEWSFLQLLQNTPLHSIAEWGRQRFGGADVPAERRLADLENSLSLVKLDAAENTPLLAPLLGIPLPQDRAPTLPAEELRRRQLAALTAWSLASASIQPLVRALEDLHWADPTSLELLRGIAERGALAPLLVVATTRPEFRPAWGMRSHHATISLAPLDRAQVRDMVAELSARHALPKEVVEDVAARTGDGEGRPHPLLPVQYPPWGCPRA